MKLKKFHKTEGRRAFRYRGTKCLNCEQPLDKSDVYCPHCSQLNSDKKLSAKDFFGEFLTSIFVYDSRLRNTLKVLLFRPGIITRNYIKGQRLKFANPFRFFLSVSIIYFLLQGLIGVFNPDQEPKALNLTADEQPINLDSLQKIIGAEQELSVNDAADLNMIDSLLQQESKDTLIYHSEATLDTMPFLLASLRRFETYQNFYSTHKIKNSSQALDSLNHKNNGTNRWLYSKNITGEKITENPVAFLNYMMGKIPFFLFFFTPFYAFFFWILYSRKRYTYMEHMVFIFHIFSFTFLAMLIFTLPDLILDTEFFTTLLFLVLGPLYFYKALRNFYQQSRLLSIIKFTFLSIVFTIGFTSSAILFVILSAAIY